MIGNMANFMKLLCGLMVDNMAIYNRLVIYLEMWSDFRGTSVSERYASFCERRQRHNTFTLVPRDTQISKSQHFDKHAYLSYRWRYVKMEASGMERASERAKEKKKEMTRRGRSTKGDKYFLSASLLLCVDISSRRKKFNVVVKADGNADCGLRASPVTALHRIVHIFRVHCSFTLSSSGRRYFALHFVDSNSIKPSTARDLYILTRGYILRYIRS